MTRVLAEYQDRDYLQQRIAGLRAEIADLETCKTILLNSRIPCLWLVSCADNRLAQLASTVSGCQSLLAELPQPAQRKQERVGVLYIEGVEI